MWETGTSLFELELEAIKEKKTHHV
jgi:hypothetical protein